jgi:hypothetical protein
MGFQVRTPAIREHFGILGYKGLKSVESQSKFRNRACLAYSSTEQIK